MFPSHALDIKPAVKVDWVGHWVCYGAALDGKVIGTIDIEKSGKSYRVNWSYTAEAKRDDGDACHMLSFVMDAEDNGEGSLIADLFGFKFEYVTDMEVMFVSADPNESFFGSKDCVEAMFTKEK